MKLNLDENLSRHLKARLVELEHDVSTTAEEGLLGQPDVAVDLGQLAGCVAIVDGNRIRVRRPSRESEAD